MTVLYVFIITIEKVRPYLVLDWGLKNGRLKLKHHMLELGNAISIGAQWRFMEVTP
jgi:hypothetical protein